MRACAVSGTVKISLPAHGGVRQALALLESHTGWLAVQVAKWPEIVPFAHGARVPFAGTTLMVVHDTGRPVRVVQDGERLLVGGPEAGVSDRVKRFMVSSARAALVPETERLAGLVGKKVSCVTLNDPRGRWGSCNKATARINYSWRLVMAPPSVLRSVAAHEVAHLVHANHGREFWALVDELDSEAGQSKRWLSRHGRGLHLVGR